MKRATSNAPADAMRTSSCCRSGSRRRAIDELFEGALANVLVETPALHLLEHPVEFLARDGPVDEALAARKAAEIPFSILELGRDAVPPQRQVLRKIGLERPLGALERVEVAAHAVLRRRLGHPPQRAQLDGDDLAQAQLLRRLALLRQEARRLDIPVGGRSTA